MARILSVYFPELSQHIPLEKRENFLRSVAKVALNFSPLVALDEFADIKEVTFQNPLAAGLNIDISGSLSLFGSEAALVDKLLSSLREKEHQTRTAVADTLGCAWAVSRFGLDEQSIVPPGRNRQALAPLPVRALRLSQKTVFALYEHYLRQVRQVFDIPISALADRFPRELIQRLDQALGGENEPLPVMRFLPKLLAAKRFEYPLHNREKLKQLVATLLEDVIAQTIAQGLSVASLCLEFQIETGARLQKKFSLSRPSCNKKHLLSLLEMYLEKLVLPAGISLAVLSLGERHRAHPRPSHWLLAKRSNQGTLEDSQEEQLAELLDILAERLGMDRVLCTEARASHIPERTFAFRPAQEPATPLATTLQVAAERPALYFPQPQALQAMAVVPDKPPFRIVWKGQAFRVRRAYGPERIAPEWWKEAPHTGRTREYFTLQLTSGLWIWVYREQETQAWFVQGVWI